MASTSNAYDHPNYSQIRQEVKTHTITATGTQHPLTFRSSVQAAVTHIGVMLGGIATTGSLILTLFHNGSVWAVMTLSNSANEVARVFTLSAERTLLSLGDRIEVGTPTHTTGTVSVVYQYRVSPGATFSLHGAFA